MLTWPFKSEKNIRVFQCLFLCFMLAASAGFELILGLSPCILCLLQRLLVSLLLLNTFIAVLKPYRSQYGFLTFWLLNIVLTLIAISLSSYHVWLQMHPTATETCLPSIDYIFSSMSWLEGIKLLLTHTDSCNKITWQWLGLTIPGWLIVCYCFLFVTQILEIRLHQQERQKRIADKINEA